MQGTISQDKIEAWRKDQRFLLAALPFDLLLRPFQVTLHMPGRIVAASNVEQVDAQRVRFVLNPYDFIESWAGVIRDDAAVARALRLADGDDDAQSVHATMKMAFSALGPHTVSVAPDARPWFDYAPEVEAALSGEADLWETLARESDFGLAETLSPAGVHLLGAVWQREVVRDVDTRWDWGAPSCRVYIRAELGDVAMGSATVYLRKARCADGHALIDRQRTRLPWNQVSLSQDRRAVLLSISLPPPPSGADVLGKLEGTIEFNVDSGPRQIDLGFSELAPGATGKRFEARIDRIGRAVWSGASGETLHFAFSRRSGLQLNDIMVVTSDGRTLPCAYRSVPLSGERGYAIMLRDGGDMPRDATIVLDVRQPPRHVELPFAFADIAIRSGKPGTLE